MKKEIPARRTVLRGALAAGCGLWMPVVPPESAAVQAANTAALLTSTPAVGADTAGATDSGKKTLAS